LVDVRYPKQAIARG